MSSSEPGTLTLDSTLGEVVANPIGRDAIGKLLMQLGQSDQILGNPILARVPLRALATLSRGPLKKLVPPPEFFERLLDLLNVERSRYDDSAHSNEIAPKWWKEAVFYQIYPRSFKDSNGDGVGDLRGIIEKLDYLQHLGVTALWLSPIYASPNDDNGYDISDYRAIMREFGTMDDFDALLAQTHARGMRLIMDLVVNHTSDEHPWFQAALAGDPKYRDYYIWREGTADSPPNNWQSFFSGPAWRYFPEAENGEGAWALHLFTSKQMDLNWENPALRADVIDMVKWWLEKGVDGFRLDVINYISKQPGLPDGDETIGELMGFKGVENYYYGPRLHEFLHQLNTEAFAPHQAFSVGETPGIGLEQAKLLTADYRQELDLVFSFDQLEVPGKTRFDDYKYDLNYLKKYLIFWTKNYPSACWMSLFYENHDNPRMVSKVNPDPVFRTVLAKLLAVIQLTSKGTPFIFQGQELGQVNQRFNDISQLRDVESLNLYQELLDQGKSEREAFAKVLAGSRDHARTPVQWTNEHAGGFTTGAPWIAPDGDYRDWNARAELADPQSVLNFYRDLIQLRQHNIAFHYGDVVFFGEKRRDYFAYARRCRHETFVIECNLARTETPRPHPVEHLTPLLSNYPEPGFDPDLLRPYEANVYRVSGQTEPDE